MLAATRAGVTPLDGRAAFAPVTEQLIGNNTPGWTGSRSGPADRPGPHPAGQPMGGSLGHYDGFSGADPSRAKMQPHPHVSALGAEQENDRRYGIIGFNDQLQIRDRHVYWDRGTQRFGSTPSVPGTPPNPHSDGPARPDLNAVNRSINPQIGSDHTSFQDDLARPYTWLGQQDGSIQPVYGGVPGLWQAYGNRGFLDGIHDPSNGEGGPTEVWSGPPHGLHSDTIPDGKQLGDRYKSTPQMRPVRFDRPDNSRIAGQSYSQTVLPQGASPAAPGASRSGGGLSLRLRLGGRGGGEGPQ